VSSFLEEDGQRERTLDALFMRPPSIEGDDHDGDVHAHVWERDDLVGEIRSSELLTLDEEVCTAILISISISIPIALVHPHAPRSQPLVQLVPHLPCNHEAATVRSVGCNRVHLVCTHLVDRMHARLRPP
jgi:hypothetical protein